MDEPWNKIYQPADYNTGELNYFTAERKLIIRALIQAQQVQGCAKLIGLSAKHTHRKINAHQIKKEEWKTGANKLP